MGGVQGYIFTIKVEIIVAVSDTELFLIGIEYHEVASIAEASLRPGYDPLLIDHDNRSVKYAGPLHLT